jgi:hypothetical protein
VLQITAKSNFYLKPASPAQAPANPVPNLANQPQQSQLTNQTPSHPSNQIPVGQLQQLSGAANQIATVQMQNLPSATQVLHSPYQQQPMPYQQQPGWFNHPVLTDVSLSGQPGLPYGQPLSGNVQTTLAPPPHLVNQMTTQLGNQLTTQLSAQERAQQEAFNREMQAFNQVTFFKAVIFCLKRRWHEIFDRGFICQSITPYPRLITLDIFELCFEFSPKYSISNFGCAMWHSAQTIFFFR